MNFVYSIGLIPVVIVLFYLVMALIFELFSEKNIKKTQNYISPLKYASDDNVTLDVKLSYCTIGLYIIILLIALIYQIEEKNIISYNAILEDINNIEGILIAYFGIVVSVIIFSVTLGPKEYYLTVTREEINKHYHIDLLFQFMGIMAVLSIICTLMLQIAVLKNIISKLLFAILQFSWSAIILGGAYSLYIVGMSTIGKKRMELYSLNNLYTVFWNNSILKLVNKTDDVIYENLGYLVKKYFKLKVIRKRKISDIKYIKFKQDISTIDIWVEYSQKTVSIFIGFFLLVFGLLYICKGKKWFLFAILLMTFLCFFLIYNEKTQKILNKYIVFGLLDKNGYEIQFKNEKTYFVGNVSFYCRKELRDYIQNIKNIMAFFCIICSCWGSHKCEVVRESLDDMVGYLKENDKSEDNFERAMYYLPVFAGAYYYYLNFETNKFPDSVKLLFESFKLSENKEKRFYLILNSFIWDASRIRLSKKDRKRVKYGRRDNTSYEKYIEKNYWRFLTDGKNKNIPRHRN